MIVHCKDPDCKEDTSLYCFIGNDGRHISPRACTCGGYKPQPADLAKFEGKPLSVPELKTFNRQQFGKVDPLCPIPDPHEPFTKTWRV
jgi:hypothetical protein